ncbi:hypothetical protein SAMN05216548_10211 [Faunimonas pinastri]|uniref:Uncharacterized protein n=1 Tax=Faunimonas pinastri TaxID=1855383 RepID=A0A1H9C0R6_9HYPH|nr:hypothetical protein SAMN05216548_10211 [Faunimonas pinastri]
MQKHLRPQHAGSAWGQPRRPRAAAFLMGTAFAVILLALALSAALGA